eukprot:7897603-Pyramimonas_sp.AAC.1
MATRSAPPSRRSNLGKRLFQEEREYEQQCEQLRILPINWAAKAPLLYLDLAAYWLSAESSVIDEIGTIR